MAYAITKGVPIPAPVRNKYPFDALFVGDSFFVPNTKIENLPIKKAARRTGFKFTGRKEGTGVRVWRIA